MRGSRFATLTAFLPGLAAATALGPATPRRSPHGTAYAVVTPMDMTVRRRIVPQLAGLLDQMLRDGRAMDLDGVKVFEAHDKFLPGKIAGAMAFLLIETPRSDPRFAEYLNGFRKISDMTADDDNETWGIYYYISALYRLKRAGLLDEAVSPDTLAKLRTRLDWRRFVRASDLTLIDLPNNYFGVAFSVARLRALMGWEDGAGADLLYDRMMDHYRRYSGSFGFADETDGNGRFDRYSILLIGEIAQRLIETGEPVRPEIKGWLRRSVDVLLPRFNLTGEGFEYGRSLGPYGETCFLEVMTAAAKLGVLTPTETRMAYAFSSRIAARYMDFWVDPRTGSVNLWDEGRRTDAYRNKHRILGENLSLARQYLYTDEEWNQLGYRNAAAEATYASWLRARPAATFTWFAKGDYDRALLTIRDGDHVIGLPLVNGADGQHMNNPYFPVPQSTGFLAGTADATYPQLVPRVELADGTVLMPLAWFKNIKVVRRGTTTYVSYAQDASDRIGRRDAVRDDRLGFETRYEFSPGRITRSDRLVARQPLRIRSLDMQFAGFSRGGVARGPGEIAFASGEVVSFRARGYGQCGVTAIASASYEATTGPMSSVVQCAARDVDLNGSRTIAWTLSYR